VGQSEKCLPQPCRSACSLVAVVTAIPAFFLHEKVIMQHNLCFLRCNLTTLVFSITQSKPDGNLSVRKLKPKSLLCLGEAEWLSDEEVLGVPLRAAVLFVWKRIPFTSFYYCRKT
jgi:Fe-S-cluster-containing hydrogenase component 2